MGRVDGVWVGWSRHVFWVREWRRVVVVVPVGIWAWFTHCWFRVVSSLGHGAGWIPCEGLAVEPGLTLAACSKLRVANRRVASPQVIRCGLALLRSCGRSLGAVIVASQAILRCGRFRAALCGRWAAHTPAGSRLNRLEVVCLFAGRSIPTGSCLRCSGRACGPRTYALRSLVGGRPRQIARERVGRKYE